MYLYAECRKILRIILDLLSQPSKPTPLISISLILSKFLHNFFIFSSLYSNSIGVHRFCRLGILVCDERKTRFIIHDSQKSEKSQRGETSHQISNRLTTKTSLNDSMTFSLSSSSTRCYFYLHKFLIF